MWISGQMPHVSVLSPLTLELEWRQGMVIVIKGGKILDFGYFYYAL